MRRNIIIALFVVLAVFCRAEETGQPIISNPDGYMSGHGYIDLGLPGGLLWSTCNMGAEEPYQRGSYFAWGETEPRENFTWENYKYFEGYGDNHYILEDIGDEISGTEYDAAREQWGSGWHLPDYQDCLNLIWNCWFEWSNINGTNGIIVHGTNGNTMFLPDSGIEWELDSDTVGLGGFYWSGTSEPQTINGQPIQPANKATTLSFAYKSRVIDLDVLYKAEGANIRPVADYKSVSVTEMNDKKPGMEYKDRHIYVNGDLQNYQIKVTDVSGRLILSEIVNDNSCNLSSLPKGIYIVSLTKDNTILTTSKIYVK